MHQIEYKPMDKVEHVPWPKTPRLFRPITVTEKIDGTNAAVQIVPIPDDVDALPGKVVAEVKDESQEFDTYYAIFAQSRTRLITPDNDNAGFAAWVRDRAQHLFDTLGPGRHYGEFWGQGIQRKYDLQEKRFSLFNTAKWKDTLSVWGDDAGLAVVPVLYEGDFSQSAIEFALDLLRGEGSVAAPGYMKPEGVVVYHSAANEVFKVLLEGDELPKSLAVAA